MQSAASHPSASEKSGSEEEAERSCSCTVFLGPADLFEKGWLQWKRKFGIFRIHHNFQYIYTYYVYTVYVIPWAYSQILR